MWRKFLFVTVGLWAAFPALATDSDYYLFREGYRYWQEGNTLKAYAVFESITRPLPPIDDLRLYATVVSAAEIGRMQRATSVMEQLGAKYPDSTWRAAAERELAAMQSSGRAETVSLSRAERVQQATRLLRQGLPLDAAKLIAPLVGVSEKSARGDTELLDLLATAYFRGRDYKKSIPVLTELLRRKGGTDLSLLTTLASAYARSSRYDDAIALQRRIMDAFPQEARRAMYKIVFLQADRNHDKEAIAAAREYLERYPNGAERLKVLWIQAWSYVRLKEWPSALRQLEAYRDAAGVRDEKRRADYWIARCLEFAGNKTGAMTAYGILSGQNGSDYYGMLAMARLRHRPVSWQLPGAKKTGTNKLNTESAVTLLSSLGMFEFMPVAGWNGSYRDLAEKVAPQWGLAPELVNAIIQVESHFRQDVVSSAGAIGLMQLIPPTAIELANVLHLGTFVPKQLYDPVWNVTLGMAYLRKLSGMFSRQLIPVIASYNAGEQAVKRWMEQTSLSDPEMFIEEIPYDETYAYVKKVLSFMW